MRKILLSLAFLAMSILSYSQAPWIKLTFDERVSFQVPDSLMKVDMEQVEIYTLVSEDSASYTVTIIDFVNFGLDSTMIQSMADTDAFEEQFKTGFMGQMEGSEMVSSSRGKLQNFTTYLFDLNYKSEGTGEMEKMYVYSVFVGSKVYSFTYSALNPSNTTKDKFFQSVKVD